MRAGEKDAALVVLALVAVAIPPAFADDEKKIGWFDTAELSYVQTAGNAETTTFGFNNKLVRAWENAAMTITAGGIRADATTTSRTATGTPDDYTINEVSTNNLTAENYYFTGGYERKISPRFFWNAGAGWDRNRFAGIENRYTGFGGVGNVWVDKGKVKFSTSYLLTYTKQDDVVPDPGVNDTFGGLRFAWDYMHKFGDVTTYSNTLVLDENLDETSDFRGDMVNSVTVAMTKRLALKASLRLLYRNEPALEAIPLSPTPAPPAKPFVTEPLDELDTIFTTSLVINF